VGTFWVCDLAGLRQLFHDFFHMLHAMVDAGDIDYEQAVLVLLAGSKPKYI